MVQISRGMWTEHIKLGAPRDSRAIVKKELLIARSYFDLDPANGMRKLREREGMPVQVSTLLSESCLVLQDNKDHT
ncbi:hypothetical protein HNY73_016527 [Argiope bruennichi]|uniref:Uncharacterized protein n=1 Tax=Argiope bruennichi TaxID=94029 RepID=A0A8T0EK77_ARGBR|nr:hypothetical protein HNY73_016527 [Argiope bruennichi]